MEKLDYAICGGHIIDPSAGLDGMGNIGVSDGKIAVVDMDSSVNFDRVHVIRADGCIVVPGLIDCHVHAYEHVTPLGVNIDERCLARGVTTVVDAGSAGASTFPGLRKFIAERSSTRLLCFLHIASHGLAAAGCSSEGYTAVFEITAGPLARPFLPMLKVNVAQCVKRIRDNGDMIVGVKVRLSESCTDSGRLEQEVFRRALQAANESQVPLMVHHTISSVPVGQEDGKMSCPLDLRPGDISTHAYHPYRSHILEPTTRVVHPDVWQAKKNGVYFDVGHGAGSFSWTVAEICAKEGFWPDIISTDLHTSCQDGPAYDLVTVMSKVHALGMPLNEVIAAVTSTPASAIKRGHCIGSLQVGREADISMLRIEDCNLDIEDCHGQMRTVKKRFVPVSVWRNGKRFEILPHLNCPNIESRRGGIKAFDKIEIHDGKKPSELNS